MKTSNETIIITNQLINFLRTNHISEKKNKKGNKFLSDDITYLCIWGWGEWGAGVAPRREVSVCPATYSILEMRQVAPQPHTAFQT